MMSKHLFVGDLSRPDVKKVVFLNVFRNMDKPFSKRVSSDQNMFFIRSRIVCANHVSRIRGRTLFFCAFKGQDGFIVRVRTFFRGARHAIVVAAGLGSATTLSTAGTFSSGYSSDVETPYMRQNVPVRIRFVIQRVRPFFLFEQFFQADKA